MRINGMGNFLSEIRKSPLTQLIGTEAQIHVAQPNNLNQDTVDISDAGKKLRLNTRKKAEEANPLPKWAQKADRALSQTIKIFERMHELATLAQDKKITDIERADMQIEIENLRANLMAMPWNLMGGDSSQVARLPNSSPMASLLGAGNYTFGDYSSTLGRMRARIANGEEWNVREAWSHGFARIAQDDNGDEVIEVIEGNAWHVVGDENVLTWSESDKQYVDSGRKVPTVREKLEWANPVIVMDAESAAAGAQYLEKQIDTVQKWREHLSTNFKDLVIEDAYLFLHEIAFPGGHHKEPLTDPTFAGAFLYSDGIYDTPYAPTKLFRKNEDSDISLADEENIKDDSRVNNYEDVRISELSKELITGNSAIESKQPKIIEIKGISVKK